MDALTPWHLALIVLAFVLLFGYKKLPDATRSLGRSLRIFRSELRGMADDELDERAAGSGSLTRTAAELEVQAAEAEALAAQLRARADAHGQPSTPQPPAAA